MIGTGDMSELALGWATYNGDHMSMYGVNASVPKTLVRHLVSWVANELPDEATRATLLDIVDTPISPELIPADEDGNITQKTEDLVGPYDLHDFFPIICCVGDSAQARYSSWPDRLSMESMQTTSSRNGSPPSVADSSPSSSSGVACPTDPRWEVVRSVQEETGECPATQPPHCGSRSVRRSEEPSTLLRLMHQHNESRRNELITQEISGMHQAIHSTGAHLHRRFALPGMGNGCGLLQETAADGDSLRQRRRSFPPAP